MGVKSVRFEFALKLLSFILLILVSQKLLSNAPYAEHIKQYRSGLDQASDIAVSETGRLYILDGSHHRVVVLSASGERKFTFGTEGTGSGQLKLPMAITIENNRVYIADTGNHRIAVFELRGWFVKNISLVHSKESGALPEPVGLIVQGNVATWSDRRNHRLCQTDLVKNQRIRCWGNRGSGDIEFQFPFHIAEDRDGYIHVVDVLNGRIQAFNSKGEYFTSISRFGVAGGELYRPNGISFANGDRMFVSDSYRGTVSIFTQGRFKGFLSTDGINAMRFKVPVGLAWNNDHLYVVDAINNSVEIFKTTAEDNGVYQADEVNSEKNKSSRINCDICHFSWVADYHSKQKDPDGVLPVGSQNMCYSCHHGAVIDSRLKITRGKQHPDIHHPVNQSNNNTEKRQDEIPKEFPLLADNQLSCGSCHTPHTTGTTNADTLYESHANPWLRVANNKGDLCWNCHEAKLNGLNDGDHPVSGVNHPVGIYLKPPQAVNPEAYASTEKLQQGLPDMLKNAGGSLGSEQQMICQSCHQVHGADSRQLLLTGYQDTELCATCHENQNSHDKNEARQKGIHPVNIDLEEPVEFGDIKVERLSCLTCHSTHNGRKGSAMLTRRIEKIEQLCATCHQRHHAANNQEAVEKSIHPVNIELEKPVLMGGKEIDNITCLTCHSVHKGKPDTPALRFKYKNGALCSYCHNKKKNIVNTDHDLRVTAENSLNAIDETPAQVGVCGSCHSMHRASKQSPFLSSIKGFSYRGEQKILQRDKLCLNCHRDDGIAKESVVNDFSHPSRDLVLRSDSKMMPLLDMQEKVSEFGAIACITCHEPHQWEAEATGQTGKETQRQPGNQTGNVLNSFLRHHQKGGSTSFCVDCHGIESRLKFKYYHDKSSRNSGVDYIH